MAAKRAGHFEGKAEMNHSLSERTVFHVDVNSAFLSWTAAQRLIDDPSCVDLRAIPSAVGGDVERRHGIILAKSIPAKRYDIRTGEPVVKALRKCPSLVLVKPDFHTYNKFSNAFVDILRNYSPVVEQVSVDEAFVDMTGSAALYSSALDVAHAIRNEIRDSLGFTVNVGISSNKILAKTASDFEKPDKVHTLYREEIAEKMWPLPIGDLYGVGRSAREKLERMGLATIGDAANADEAYLRKVLGNAFGAQVHAYANGIDDTPVKTRADKAKGYGNSTTLCEDLTVKNAGRILPPTLLALSDSVATRMRRDRVRAFTIAVTLKTSEFVTHSKQTKLDNATNDTDEIYHTARRLFDALWKSGEDIRLVGVSAGNLTEEEYRQASLFDDESDEKKERRERLAAVTDSIRNKYGKPVITRALLLNNELTRGIGKKDD